MRFTALFLAVILALLFVGSSATAEEQPNPINRQIKVAKGDWPWWRGPHGTGVADPDQKPPTKWSQTQNVLWRVPIPGRGHGSPIVVGDHVLIPTAIHDKDVQAVICLDRSTGKSVWGAAVHQGGLMKGNRKASQASSTLAWDGERYYVTFVNGGAVQLTALMPNGKLAWQQKVSDYVIHQGYGASPVLYQHLVIAAADNKTGGAIAAYERKTGKPAWRIDRPKLPNYPTPSIVHVNGKDQLIMIGCDLVTSIDPLTGKKNWEFEGATTECVTTTVTDGKHIYTSGGYPKNHVAAIVADGSKQTAWRNSQRVYVPSMLYRAGYLYALGDAGSAFCWKSDTGKQAWRQRLGGGFSASPVLVGDTIYALNEKGACSVFKADPTRFQLIATNKVGIEALASPAICGGRIYLRVAHRDGKGGRGEALYCIGSR